MKYLGYAASITVVLALIYGKYKLTTMPLTPMLLVIGGLLFAATTNSKLDASVIDPSAKAQVKKRLD
jgi:uncharacterized membrane protein